MIKRNKNYQLQANARLLKDAASVRFHVENEDYFGTAATLVRLLQEQLKVEIKSAPAPERALIEKAFKNLETDLLILQKNYQIKAKKKKSQEGAKGKLKSQ